MQIRYVVSTMVFWWRENHLSLEQECQFLKSLGFGVELWPNIKGHNECRYERQNWQRLAAATEDMLVSMRCRTDEPTIERWDEQIQCAKMLNANIVADLRSLGIADGSDLDSYDFAAEVVKLTEDNNVKLCLETGRLPTLQMVGERFESLLFCFDAGFANLDPQFSFKEYVDGLVPKIAHLHLTDNYGQIDDHEATGLRGGISRQNWDYLLSALSEYNNEVIGSLEMSPSMPAVMIRRASEFLFDELKWPNKPRRHPGYASVAYNPT